MTDRNAAPPQDADRKSGDGSQEGHQRPLRPAMVMAIRGDDGGVSPKSGPTKGRSPPQIPHLAFSHARGRDRAIRNIQRDCGERASVCRAPIYTRLTFSYRWEGYSY